MASCARVALSADRNTHRLKRGHIRRTLHRASCAAASPTSTSVTRFQSGGSPSSVEHVDVIGSSFPLRATAESSIADLLPVSPSLAPKGTPFELHVRKGAGRGFSGNTMFIRPVFGHRDCHETCAPAVPRRIAYTPATRRGQSPPAPQWNMTQPRFVPARFIPPRLPKSAGFTLVPLRLDHNEGDLDAWSSSVDHIHATPGFAGHPWPDEPMTLERNARDLAEHESDFAHGRGFTYSVVSEMGNEVIGCVYIHPSAKEGVAADVRSWVRLCAPRNERRTSAGGARSRADGHIVGPQLRRHCHRTAVGRRPVSAGVPMGKCRRSDPALE